MQNKDNYHLAIDGIRILAILSVICIHSTTRILEANSLNIQGSILAFFFNQVSRFAVPTFFMISGFVLEVNYPFHQSYISYLKKRLSKILLPYLFWSSIYYFFVYKQHTISLFQAILDGSASYQLYFVPTLLIFYALFPFAHKFYRFISNKWILAALGFLQVALLIDDYYIRPIAFFYPLTIFILNYYIFILGTILAHHHKLLLEKVSKWKIAIIFFLIFLAFFVFMEGRILYLLTHNYLNFYSQWRPSVLVYSVVIFSVLYFLLNKLKNFDALIKELSRLSLFVFFIHVIVLELIWQTVGKDVFYKTLNSFGQQFWFDPLFFISIVVVSYIAAYLFKKLPATTTLCG